MIAPAPATSSEPSVTASHLAAAITAAAAMNIKEKERVYDRIHAEQPNLLASVFALPRLGVSMTTVDVLLNMLIVIFLAVENSGQALEKISEEAQKRELRSFTSIVQFVEGMDAEALRRSIQQSTAHRKERVLLTYVVDMMQCAGLLAQQDDPAK